MIKLKLSLLLILFGYLHGEKFMLYIDGPCEISENDNLVNYVINLHGGSGFCMYNLSMTDSAEILTNSGTLFNVNNRRESLSVLIKDDYDDEPDELITLIATCQDQESKDLIQFIHRIMIRDDDGTPFVSSFSTRVLVPANVFNGSIFVLNIEALAGSGTCKISSSNKNFLTLLPLDPESTSLKTSQSFNFRIKAASFLNGLSSVHESLALECSDNKDKAIYTFHYPITIINYEFGSSPLFTYEVFMTQNIVEGDDLIIIAFKSSGSGKCIVEHSPFAGSLVYSGNFTLNDDNPQALEVLRTFVSSSGFATRKELVTISCKDLFSDKTYNQTRSFYIRKKPGFGALTAKGDPHFMQRVFDERKKRLRTICYDVTARSGDTIFILKQSGINSMSIYGQLKDDFYMHIIKIVSVLGHVTFTTDKISFSNGAHLRWDDFVTDMFYVVGNYSISFEKNQIKISYLNKNLQKHPLEVIVIRSNRPLTGHYLDVSFNGINNKYDNIDGLLGRIGRNHFRFYSSVQRKSSKFRRTPKVAVMVNGHLIVGKIVTRNNEECWLLSVKDLLIYNTVNDFVISEYYRNGDIIYL